MLDTRLNCRSNDSGAHDITEYRWVRTLFLSEWVFNHVTLWSPKLMTEGGALSVKFLL